jgi:hypothetical protein
MAGSEIMAETRSDDGAPGREQARNRRSMVLFACGAVVGLALAGYSLFTAKGTHTNSVPPEAMALVNGRPILRSDFVTQVQSQFGAPYEKSTRDQRRKVLDDMVAEELSVQRGVEIDLPSFDPDVRTAMVAGVELEVTANVLAQEPSPEPLRKWYETHKSQYASEASFRMRDLVAHIGPQRDGAQAGTDAARAVAALRAGQALDQVVRAFGLQDAANGGNAGNDEILDFAAKAKLDASVYAAASRLSAGSVSDPVAAEDGTHVVVMIAHKPSVPRPFEAVSDRVRADYKKAAQAQVLRSNVEFLRGRADIQLSDDARALSASDGHVKVGA